MKLMNLNYKKLAGILILITMLLVSCSENDDTVELDKNAKLNVLIKTSAASDILEKGGDSGFSSLAIYIFNKADGYCEYSELVPVFTPESVKEFSRSVNVSPQTKVIYAVANYNDPDKNFSIPITKTLTMQELDALTVDNPGFSSNKILMIGKQEVEINDIYVVAEVPIERLVARLDIYMFKNQELANDSLVVTSLEFHNEILNSNVRYQDLSMVSPIHKKDEAVSLNYHLRTMPTDISGVVPANAQASFYTYQNSSTSLQPTADSPYLRVTVLINGNSYTYKAYLGDNRPRLMQYSLNRNIVYKVIAMLDHPDNELILTTTPYPWTVTESEIGHEVKDTDYSLDPYNENDPGAIDGYVEFPYVDNGVVVEGTSYANYNFKLTAPAGVVWTASLTNGLDFKFTQDALVPANPSVWTGIARNDPYQIRIGATKEWNGVPRSTYFYISVDGTKLKINPLQSNGTRKFPGTNDTDILITQTESQ